MIHHGSVVSMPFDNEQYNGIFCYSLIHLLNKTERRAFLKSCFNQLKKAVSIRRNGRLFFQHLFRYLRGQLSPEYPAITANTKCDSQ